jgi:hypothetical protein
MKNGNIDLLQITNFTSSAGFRQSTQTTKLKRLIEVFARFARRIPFCDAR